MSRGTFIITFNEIVACNCPKLALFCVNNAQNLRRVFRSGIGKQILGVLHMAEGSMRYPNRIKEVIKRNGLTEKEVAEETKIPLRTLSSYCSGKVPIPRKRLEDIAHIVGCAIPDLVPSLWGANGVQLSFEGGQENPIAQKQLVLSPSPIGFPLPQSIIEQGSVFEEFYMDQLRRDLLHLLGTAGVMLPFSELAFDWKQVRNLIARPSQVDAQTLSSLAMVNQHLWELYKTTISK